MRLYLIRHGRTDSNANHLLDTAHPGAPLDQTGLEQADTLAERLGRAPLEAIYSSDLTRAVETATPLAGRHGFEVQQLPGLREIPAGIEEMNTDWSVYIDMIARWGADPTFTIDGSEDAHTFIARYDAAIARIAAAHDVAAAVSHGAAIRVWITYRARNIEIPNPRRLANTDIVTLDGSPADGWTVHRWADEVFPR